VIYANGASVFYHVLGFLPPTAPIAMPVLYAAGDVPACCVRCSPAAAAAKPAALARRLSYRGRVDRQQWDARYSGAEYEWSMHPNLFVAAELDGVPPGRALDLAAGEGRNSVWLAERGWRVTAVDFSRVGLDKGRKLSAAHGVADGQVDWIVADLSEYPLPRSSYDLVLIAYLQVSAALRARVLAGAAAALVPGGTLLVVGHDLANLAEGTGGPSSPDVLYTPEAITEALPGLRIIRAERVRRPVERDGTHATAVDTLVRAERPANEQG
jgi:SAM-dependent methyltransferase